MQEEMMHMHMTEKPDMQVTIVEIQYH